MSILLEERSNDKANAADFSILYEDDKTKITFWRFEPGAETGWHHHNHDYVTIQKSGGRLKIENESGEINFIDYENNRAAGYAAPVIHNASNVSDVEVRVIEIEYKFTKA